jgi:hypothetical protein
MADLGMEFDPNAVEPDDRNFDLLPPGKYVVEITESDVVETKARNGLILKLTYTVVEGPATNRKIWQNINYKNASPEAQRIGQRQVSTICRAIGHDGPLTDSAVLHGIPMLATVGIERDKTGEYGDKNKVATVAPLNGQAAAPAPVQRQAAPAQTRPTPTSRPAPASAGGGKMAWPARAGAAR